LILLAILNGPAILFLIPGFGVLFFLPFLIWINIPGTFLAKVIGPPHFIIQKFGVTPQTPLAWFLTVTFWTLLAFGLTFASAYLPEVKLRFTLRTLLIVITLVAFALGLIVWASR
jgi:hypothetical protein